MSAPATNILEGSARPHPPESQLLGDVEESKQVGFTVLVRPKAGAPELPDLEFWEKTPLNQRTFPTPEEFSEKYGSSEEDAATIASTLKDHGMTILDQNLGTGAITAVGTTTQIKSLLGVQLNYYHKPTPVAIVSKRRGIKLGSHHPLTETYHGYTGKLSIPSHLHGLITHIVGLDSRSISAPGGFSGDPPNSTRLLVTDVAQIYNFPPGIDSTNQVIGIFNGGCPNSNYNPTDITKYFSNQIPGFQKAPTVVPVPLTVGSNNYSNNPASPTYEVTQDIQTSATIAQGCTVNVYFSDYTELGWLTFLNRLITPGTEKRPHVVSCSWTMYDEFYLGTNFSTLFQRLAASGVTFFAVSGDWGSNDNDPGAEHVGYPASDPWVTTVGGTVVGNVVKSTDKITFDEYAWSDINNPSSQFTFSGGGTTGGGMSQMFPTPPYQLKYVSTALGLASFKDSAGTVKTGGRFLPDIAANVGYNGFILDGSPFNFIGTSCSAPLMAGLFASYRAVLHRSFGLLNPTLYQLGFFQYATSPVPRPQRVFNDVKIGNNDSGDTPDDPYFTAAYGFDPVSGWGSVNGPGMEYGLRHPPP